MALPFPFVTLVLQFVALPFQFLTWTSPFMTLPVPFRTLPFPFMALPFPFVILAFPFVTLPFPFETLHFPCVLVAFPFVILPFPSVTLGCCQHVCVGETAVFQVHHKDCDDLLALPDLGKCSVTVMLRTGLFPYNRSRLMNVTPAPPAVFYMLSDIFKTFLATATWKLPTLEEVKAKMIAT
jgi:hypothetical protein